MKQPPNQPNIQGQDGKRKGRGKERQEEMKSNNDEDRKGGNGSREKARKGATGQRASMLPTRAATQLQSQITNHSVVKGQKEERMGVRAKKLT